MRTTITAKRLVEARGERTQKEIATEAGISQSTYAMYEMGKRRPTDENKIKLAGVCSAMDQTANGKHKI